MSSTRLPGAFELRLGFVQAVPEWRWQLGREDCPWYPTMRLFRQQEGGKWDNVFEQLAVELQSQSALEKPEFYLRNGRNLTAAGKLPQAMAALRRGLELAPNDSMLHNELSVIQTRQDAKQEALASFEKAVALKADNVEALFNLGNLLSSWFMYGASWVRCQGRALAICACLQRLKA